MTGRLYYDDPYRVQFAGQVVERLEWEGHPAVVLDQTAFYPTGGGQPHDTGTLDDIAVVDVMEREDDGAVVHLMAAPLASDQVQGTVDWARRFDLMQQHTGQHILSAVFVEQMAANTVGFHLSGDYSTIDLDRAPLSAAELAAVEAVANDIVFANQQTTSRFVPDAEVPHLPLRKPLAHEGPVRVVEIPDLDCSACGGTHVRATGEIGLIKITRTERRGSETRVEFLCGGRALGDYAAKNDMVMDLAQEYTVGHWELADMVHRMEEELKATRRELRRTRDALLDAEAASLWHEAHVADGTHTVQAELPDRTPDDLKHLAQRLISRPQTVALLGARSKEDGKGFLTFARSADLDAHMGALIRQACAVIGGGGGGRPEFAQGGGPHGDRVEQALDKAFHAVTSADA
jgi:alanyl-tRNA synthetase